MAKIPQSFAIFQSLVIESESLTELGDNNGSQSKCKEASLSFLCDDILSTLYSIEAYRDLVVDSRANVANGSILLIINPEFDVEKIGEVLQVINDVGGVSGSCTGAKKSTSGLGEVTVIKVTGSGSDNKKQKTDD